MNDIEQRKAQVKKTFDTVAEGYGSTGMEFFHNAAAHLPRVFALQGHEHLLDVATGTGIAATALAPHLPRGRVTGIDLSEGMLAQARARADAKALNNIALHPMDMTNIGFDDAHFDAANCSFGIFFLPDMLGVLRHIASKVKPGGQIVTCAFYEDSFEPQTELFLNRIQRYGVKPPDIAWKQIGTEDSYRALYASAGLGDIAIHSFDVGYPLSDAETWWRVIWYAGFRGLVMQLGEADLAEFKRDHLAEVEALRTEQGIPLKVGVQFASGRVAGS